MSTYIASLRLRPEAASEGHPKTQTAEIANGATGEPWSAVASALARRGLPRPLIQEDDTPSREFLRVTFGNVPEEERCQVRKQLGQYCGQDTEGMIWIMDALADLTGR